MSETMDKCPKCGSGYTGTPPNSENIIFDCGTVILRGNLHQSNECSKIEQGYLRGVQDTLNKVFCRIAVGSFSPASESEPISDMVVFANIIDDLLTTGPQSEGE